MKGYVIGIKTNKLYISLVKKTVKKSNAFKLVFLYKSQVVQLFVKQPDKIKHLKKYSLTELSL